MHLPEEVASIRPKVRHAIPRKIINGHTRWILGPRWVQPRPRLYWCSLDSKSRTKLALSHATTSRPFDHPHVAPELKRATTRWQAWHRKMRRRRRRPAPGRVASSLRFERASGGNGATSNERTRSRGNRRHGDRWRHPRKHRRHDGGGSKRTNKEGWSQGR